ncbi:MAG: HEPN domain-containing protein [Chloroflexota bacterium]
MPTKIELQDLAETRLQEAKSLYNSGLYDGCYYIAGYVIELALKARICKLLDVNEYPESGEISRSFKTHKLDTLLVLSGLRNTFLAEGTTNPRLLSNWSLITEWSEELRYSPLHSSSKIDAEKILSAMEDVHNGVFVWLKKHW